VVDTSDTQASSHARRPIASRRQDGCLPAAMSGNDAVRGWPAAPWHPAAHWSSASTTPSSTTGFAAGICLGSGKLIEEFLSPIVEPFKRKSGLMTAWTAVVIGVGIGAVLQHRPPKAAAQVLKMLQALVEHYKRKAS
jgi:hypothetical protein